MLIDERSPQLQVVHPQLMVLLYQSGPPNRLYSYVGQGSIVSHLGLMGQICEDSHLVVHGHSRVEMPKASA